jgi:hypothetical protein
MVLVSKIRINRLKIRNNKRRYNNNNINYINIAKKKFDNLIVEIDKLDRKYRMTQFPTIPFFKLGLGAIGIITTGGICYYLSRTYIIKEGSHVASEIVKSGKTQESIEYVLKHPDTTKITDEFLKARFTTFLNEKWFNDLLQEKIQDTLTNLTKEKWFNDLLQEKITETLGVAVKNPENIRILQDLIVNLLKSNETIDTTSKSLRKAGFNMFNPSTWSLW